MTTVLSNSIIKSSSVSPHCCNWLSPIKEQNPFRENKQNKTKQTKHVPKKAQQVLLDNAHYIC